MPDKGRRYQSRRRGRRKEARRAVAKPRQSVAVSAPPSLPKTITAPPQPVSQTPSGAKATPAKTSPEQILKVTPISELKRIGIIAGSMFVILFILAFILK